MLLGTGVDLIEVERIAQSIERYGDRFLRRIFTDQEIAFSGSGRHRSERLAARFAAKEAGSKALGTGMNLGVSWRDFEVTRVRGSRPNLELSGEAARRASQLGVRSITLSLTHTREAAIAMVILED